MLIVNISWVAALWLSGSMYAVKGISVPDDSACPVLRAPSPPDGGNDAEAIVRAMLIHDLSIFSMEWHCETQQQDADNWKVIGVLEHGMDERGRWYGHTQYALKGSSGDWMDVRVRTWTSDNTEQRLYNESSDRLMVQPPDRTSLWYANPAMYLGRMVSAGGVRRLGELLLAADQLRILDPENTEGVVRVGGTVDTGGMIAEVEVDVDTTRAFIPIRIRTLDGMTLYPVEVLTVTRIEKISDQYVPAEGTRETYYFGPNEEQLKQLEKAVTAAGVDFKRSKPDPRDPEVRRKYRTAVRTAFGEAGAPCALVGPPQRMAKTFFVSINRNIPDEKFAIEPGIGGRLVNLFEGTDGGEPMEDPDGPLEGSGIR